MLPAVNSFSLWVTLPVTLTSFGLLPHPAVTTSRRTADRARHRRTSHMQAPSGSVGGDGLPVGRADHQAQRRGRDGITYRPDAAVAEQELGARGRGRAPVAAAAILAADGPSGAGHQVGEGVHLRIGVDAVTAAARPASAGHDDRLVPVPRAGVVG